VCMGNICRSPTAHGVFQALVLEENLSTNIIVESAGTTGYHVGELPDRRASATASEKGVDLSYIKARQVHSNDFFIQDYILAMDHANLQSLKSDCPTENVGKLELLLNYHPDKYLDEVPDPYYGGDKGFENVYEMINIACRALLIHIKDEIHK
jgi:protein-tyrosine phosphatase